LRGSIGLIAATAALVALVLPGSVVSATNTKPYTANICLSGPCIAPVTAPSLAGGATATVDLTLKDVGTQQQLGSANVTAPLGFTVTNVTGAPAGSSWAGRTAQLRNLNLAPGASTTVTISVSVPCQSSSPDWAITAKQSNNYNGPPGNDLTLVPPPDSSLTTTVTGSCKLVFVKQPANAQVNTTITSVPDNPSGDKVQVQVWDGSNNPITTATGTVLLTASSNPNPTPFGGTSAQLQSGTATFTSLNSSATGTYRLIASGDGFTSSDPSSEFTISDFGTFCPASSTTCSGGTSSSDKKTQTSVTSTGLHGDTTLEINMLDPTLVAPHCDGFSAAPSSNGVSVDVQPLTDLTQITITLDKSIVNSFPDNGVAHFNVCFGGIKVGSPGTQLPTKPGTPPAQFNLFNDGLWWGILPDCTSSSTTPCVASRNKTGSGQAVIVFKVFYPWDLKGYTG
jgi:hypothetical protein